MRENCETSGVNSEKKRSRRPDNDEGGNDNLELLKFIKQRFWHRVANLCQKRLREQEDGIEGPSTSCGSDSYPLHLACEYNPPVHVLRLLIQCFPSALTQRVDGCVPLQVAAQQQVSLAIWTELVQAAPSVVTIVEEETGQTVLDMLLDARVQTDSNRVCENYATNFWQLVDVVLQALAGEIDMPDRPLHAAVYAVTRLGAHRDVVQYALFKYPGEVNVSANGLLPLHVAVGPRPSFISSRQRGIQASRCRWRNIHRRGGVFAEASLVQELVSLYPDSVMQFDANGRYPVHHAAANGHSWSDIQHLSRDDLLDTLDPVTGWYPYQCAAVRDAKSSSSLDVIYQLVRNIPGAVVAQQRAGRVQLVPESSKEVVLPVAMHPVKRDLAVKNDTEAGSPSMVSSTPSPALTVDTSVSDLDEEERGRELSAGCGPGCGCPWHTPMFSLAATSTLASTVSVISRALGFWSPVAGEGGFWSPVATQRSY